VIVGHLIPAGTGQRIFDGLIVGPKSDQERLSTIAPAEYAEEIIKANTPARRIPRRESVS
jgi:hypothetical protein